MDKYIVVYTYNGMLFIHKKELSTDIHAITWMSLKNITLKERSQSGKVTLCMTAFMVYPEYTNP